MPPGEAGEKVSHLPSRICDSRLLVQIPYHVNELGQIQRIVRLRDVCYGPREDKTEVSLQNLKDGKGTLLILLLLIRHV